MPRSRRLRWVPAAAAIFAALCLALACSGRERPRNAILIVLDTLRADRLSAYGYPVETSPAIDRLAAEGVLFETVVSNASWTLPAMVALMAGDLPTRKIFDRDLERSLVETIRAAGLRTVAFVEGGFVSGQYGFDLGFDEFYDVSLGSPGEGGGEDPPAAIESTFRSTADWLRKNRERPFFLWLHTYEPHTPYTRRDYAEGLPSGSIGETFEVIDAARVRQGSLAFGPIERTYVRALYDGGVKACDREIAGLLAVLEELGLRDDTLIAVTSDHGEDIGGREPEWPGVHGHSLYDEQILVPLVLYDPTHDYEVKRVTGQVRTIDTLHSILDILGIPAVESLHGRSFVPMMTGEERDSRYAWSHVQRADYFGYAERYALRTGAHKLILTPTGRGNYVFELYDLASDPGETRSIHTSDPVRRANLQKLLHGLRDGLRADGMPTYRIRAAPRKGQAPAQGEDPEEGEKKRVEERLRELGYVE